MIAGAREDGMLGIRTACLDGDVTRCTPATTSKAEKWVLKVRKP